MSGKLTKKAHSDALAEARKAMSPELLAELQAVAALPDEQINTDDIPEVRDWSGAVRGRFSAAPTKRLTLNVDADVIEYFRENAPGGYLQAMNRALRATMLHEQRRRRDRHAGEQGRAKG